MQEQLETISELKTSKEKSKMTKNSIAIESKRDSLFSPISEPCFSWNKMQQDENFFGLALEDFFFPTSGLFASVGIATPEAGFLVSGNSIAKPVACSGSGSGGGGKVEMGFKIRIGNPHLKRLLSGAIAGVVSRTAVAPLETIRTHLMVGSNGNSTGEVFDTILKTEGWKGLFRGNFVNVIRVAPSKAVELFTFDTVHNVLSPKEGEPLKIPVPSSLVAGAMAGVSSTLCTYPLELIKTRFTIQRDVYKDFCHCFMEILKEGPSELYRGLTPSLIGIVPYAAINYYTYDTIKKLYRKTFKTQDVHPLVSLFIGAASGAISSSATFPLEVARKHMQVGAVGGRQVYKNMLHALLSILENEGVAGLYKGIGPSCMKLVPAAGMSFMCYEVCKKIMIEEEGK